ncbi:hypothetical protein ACHAPT_001712 [Fusarium lateritium]
MSRKNNRRAKSSKPTNRASDIQTTASQSTRRRNQKNRNNRSRNERRNERRREVARNRAREPTVDSDGDIDAISESDEEMEQRQQQQQQTRRRNANHDNMQPDRAGTFDFQRLRSAVTSIIEQCVKELGVGNKMEDYMDWQPEPTRPVYLVLLNEVPCYPEGKVRRH